MQILKLKLPAVTIATTLILVGFNACRPTTEQEKTEENQSYDLSHLGKNTLSAQSQSSLLTSQAESPIHWQNWSKTIFKDAAKDKKTVFAFIGSGTNAFSLNALKQLQESQETCATLNENHVNILIDSNIYPDLDYFAASLCLKSGTNVSSPILVWFSYEGIPISWVPINQDQKQHISEFISRTSHTVTRMWRDSPDYVLKNSRDDFTRRMASSIPQPTKDELNLIPIRATRQAASLFDPTSSTIDGLGGMSIARYVKLMTLASAHPEISDTQRKHYLNIACQTADNMILHGLIDPLDQGVYSGVQRSTTALPVFSKKLKTQAHTIDALCHLYQASGNTRYLDAAHEIINYTEKKLKLPSGDYSLGIINAGVSALNNPCTWTMEELEAALTQDEFDLCVKAFNIKALGNIPLIDDRDRIYFRKNTLTWKTPLADIATSTATDIPTLNQKLKSVAKKLSKLRTEKSSDITHEKLSTAEATALYTSACISAYRATGNEKNLNQAKLNLEFIRDHFFDEEKNLHHARYNGQLLQQKALGIDYAQTCQAALDFYEVTANKEWLEFALNVHLSMSKHLVSELNFHITESEGNDYPYPFTPYQFISFRNLDNSNTWALAYGNAKRLNAQRSSAPQQKQSEQLESILLSTIQISSLAGIDYLITKNQEQRPTIYLKQPISQDIMKTAISSTCNIIAVNEKAIQPNQLSELENKATQMPSGSAMITQQGKILGTTTQATELKSIIQKLPIH